MISIMGLSSLLDPSAHSLWPLVVLSVLRLQTPPFVSPFRLTSADLASAQLSGRLVDWILALVVVEVVADSLRIADFVPYLAPSCYSRIREAFVVASAALGWERPASVAGVVQSPAEAGVVPYSDARFDLPFLRSFPNVAGLGVH